LQWLPAASQEIGAKSPCRLKPRDNPVAVRHLGTRCVARELKKGGDVDAVLAECDLDWHSARSLSTSAPLVFLHRWPTARCGRHTTSCGAFRSLTNRSNRSRSATLIEICSIFLIGADSQVRADL